MDLFGLVTPVHVRHVYAADLYSVQLLDRNGHRMPNDDVTLQLSQRATAVMRRGDPPLLSLSLYDAAARDGHCSQMPGPCPLARRWAIALIRDAEQVIAHIPIPERADWLDSLCPGCSQLGDLLLVTAAGTHSITTALQEAGYITVESNPATET